MTPSTQFTINSLTSRKSLAAGTRLAVHERRGLIGFGIAYPVTVRVADWLYSVVAPVADAAARYRVPESAVVRPVSESVDDVAPVMSVHVVPASYDRCHW